MESVSVVIVPSGSTGEAVRAMVSTWTRAGITDRLLVVRSGDVEEVDPEPVRVRATLVERDGETSVDLFAYLGRYRLELVRIVLVHLVSREDRADSALSRTAVTVAAAVQASLPLDPSGRPVTRLHRTVLVVPVTGGHGVPTDILIPAWDANVIISSEDRPDVDRPSVFVRASENFAGHAAAALCAAAGVIRGIPVGALDGVVTDSSTSPDDVVVARVSIRTVVGEDVLDVLTRRALDPSALEPTGAAQVVSWAYPASDPDLIVDRAAGAILRSPEWEPSPAPREESVGVVVDRVGRSAAEAARFNLRTTAAVAAWTVSRSRDQLDAVATDVLAGEGGGSIVTVGPRVLAQLESVAGAAISSQRRVLDERLTYAASRGTQPPPATWSDLREMAFALADGSPLEGIDEPKQLGKRELLIPQDVVPAPGSTFTLEDGSPLDALDPAGIHRYRDDLAARIEQNRLEVTLLERGLDDARYQLTQLAYSVDLPDPPVAASTPVSDDGKDQSGEDTDRSAPTATDPRVTELTARAQKIETELEARRLDLDRQIQRQERFGAWFTEISSSVLWRVGDDVSRRLEHHERWRRKYHESKDDVAAPAAAFLERAKRRLLRTWWWTIPITAILLGAVAYVATEVLEDPHWGKVAGVAGAILVLAVVILTAANHSFYKSFRRYEFELAKVLARQRFETETFLWAGKELVRLRVLLGGWKDWARVIGEVLHRTWESPSSGYEELPDDVVNRLPAAVAVARQEDEQLELPPDLVVRTYQELYRPGWARQAFADAYDEFSQRLSGDEATGYLDVDVDPVSTSLTPRGQLVTFWQSGEGRAFLGRRQRDRLRSMSHEGDLNLPERAVRRLGPFSDEQTLDESEYFAPTSSSSTTFALDVFGSRARSEQRHYVRRASLWLPSIARRGMQNTVGDDQKADLRVDAATAATALRVDVSRRVHPGLLTVFAAEAPLVVAVDEGTGEASADPILERAEASFGSGRRARRQDVEATEPDFV